MIDFSYFGARYYDSEVSVWLSVDPMADEYPSTSPYMYVLGKPTALIDPNGMNAIRSDADIAEESLNNQSNKTTFTYTLDYKLNESNIPFVETFRHLTGNFCEVQNTGTVSDYQQGDDGAGYEVKMKIPNLSPWNRDNPTYSTATGTGTSLDNLTFTRDNAVVNAFFDGMTVGALTGLATELIGAALKMRFTSKTNPIKFPGNDPTKAPKGFEWRGKPGSKPGSKDGNWYNPKSGESLRPDLNHPKPIGPHWDYKSPAGKWYRILPDGTVSPKI